MASGYQRFLSGLGAAEDSVLSTDESATGGAGGAGDASSDGGSGAPASASSSGGPGWGAVLTTAASALPVLAKDATDAYRTYEASHGGIAHAGGGSPASGGGSARPSAPSRPWYESPTFLIGAGIGLVLAIVTFTRRK